MTITNVLSFTGGYFNSKKFELDIPKIADILEASEEDIEREIKKCQSNGDIKLDGNIVTLINIEPKKDKKFSEQYAPVETIEWGNGMKLKLDK